MGAAGLNVQARAVGSRASYLRSRIVCGCTSAFATSLTRRAQRALKFSRSFHLGRDHPDMNKQSFFWRIMCGEAPPPKCADTLGIVFLNVDAEAGSIEVQFEGRSEFTNPVGNIQGGFLAAMLDDTMGPALSAMLDEGQFAPTLNLNVSFHRPAKVGRLIGRGRVVKRGRDICFLAGELYQDEQLVASATATAMIRAS